MNRNGQLDLTPSWQYDSPNVGTALTFGDINGDGHVDLVIGVSGQPCVSVFYSNLIAGVERDPLPKKFDLSQNYPNPFNPSTVILFSVPQSAFVTLRIFNIVGQQVATLFSENVSASTHQVEWNAQGFAVGVYFCRLQAGDFVSTKKLILLK